ncbi:MAG: KamA family radical SAM protein [Ruminococcaceae bacterium]|nr:KamA family radical SAM protein [Oscillospiraceae bacterium]
MNWEKEYANSICTAEQLCAALGLPETEIPRYERILALYPMQITPYYLSLVDPADPADPIARMCIPSEDELDPSGTFDTSGEGDNTRQEGVQHKYRQTALILTTHVCAMYCRHCFRKRMVGISDAEQNKQAHEAASYVRAHPEITNVLLSGGDPLMCSHRLLGSYLQELCDIDTLDFIRIGSRVPVTFPRRICEDRELLDLLDLYAREKTLLLVTQFNHPREITPEAIRAVQAFQDRGIQVRNQTVLLRGVNDSAETLGTLLRRLTQIGVMPYYVFQCRPVTGVKGRFQVPLREGVGIVDGAKALQNGVGKAIRYAMSHPRGKIEILGEMEPGRMLFKFHQSRDASDASRLFTAELGAEDTWLDGELQGV